MHSTTYDCGTLCHIQHARAHIERIYSFLHTRATKPGLHENAKCRNPGVRSPGVVKMRSVENAEC